MIGLIRSSEPIAAQTYDLRVELDLLHARPGQFVHVKCGESRLLRRPISLCGYEKGVARLVFAVKGEGTRWLSMRKPGQSLDVLGPLGNGFALSDQPTLLVGGGIGVPPLLYASQVLQGQTHALLGFRHQAACCLASEFPAATLFTDDGSAGVHGYPHLALADMLKTENWKQVLACGPTPLLRAVAKVTQDAGVACQVSLEERMGCGVGACLVCACAVGGTYRHVCKDGPVFEAREVDWRD